MTIASLVLRVLVLAAVETAARMKSAGRFDTRTVLAWPLPCRGQVCRFVNYGVPEERGNPAHAGRILVEPCNGTAMFDAPAATYAPRPGFEGVDEFSYEATAVGRGGAALRLLVRVRITVAAPR